MNDKLGTMNSSVAENDIEQSFECQKGVVEAFEPRMVKSIFIPNGQPKTNSLW